MSRFAIHKSALAGLLLFGGQFPGHAQTVPITAPGFATTTGMVGVASTQTARLNVLNLQPVIPGVTAALCPATLEFYDETGALLKQLTVTTVPPGTAVSLALKPVVPSTAVSARAQIRAVLLTPSVPVSGPIPAPFMPVIIGCAVMGSLEIIDDSTGATHILTTDLRAVPVYGVVPLTPAR